MPSQHADSKYYLRPGGMDFNLGCSVRFCSEHTDNLPGYNFFASFSDKIYLCDKFCITINLQLLHSCMVNLSLN